MRTPIFGALGLVGRFWLPSQKRLPYYDGAAEMSPYLFHEINAEAALAALSGCAEGLVPGRANAAQERRIDDQLAERVD